MPTSDDIICIYTTYDSTEADMIKSHLESEEIPCYLKTDNAGGVLPHLTQMTGIGLMVLEKDASKAKQIIKGHLDANKG